MLILREKKNCGYTDDNTSCFVQIMEYIFDWRSIFQFIFENSWLKMKNNLKLSYMTKDAGIPFENYSL